MFRERLLPWIVFVIYRVWTWTWRYEYIQTPAYKEADKNGARFIYAHWHGDELAIVALVTPFKIATMTSTSKDGQLIDFVIRRLHGATSRGSSTRGGIGALKGLVRLLKTGFNASMAVDGPKGPYHKVKPGVFELSRLAGAHIIPLGVATSRAHVFEKSWNKAKLPLPFARIPVIFPDPWPVIERGIDSKDPELALKLETDIAKACQLASEHLK